MRRLVFSLCALAAIAVICVCTNMSVKKMTEQFSQTVLKFAEMTRENEVSSSGKKIEDEWERKKRFISLFVNEEIFEEADRQIFALKYSQSAEEFRKRCVDAVKQVSRIIENELPGWGSILFVQLK